MHLLTIVGLGTSNHEALTLGAYRALKEAETVILRTSIHPIIPFLNDEEITYTSLDEYYETAETFDKAYESMVKAILLQLEQASVVLAVPGHPCVGDVFIERLLECLNQKQLNYTVIGGVTRADYLLKDQLVSNEGFNIITANNVSVEKLNPRVNTIITELNDPITVSEAKIALQRVFPDEYEVVLSMIDEMGKQTNSTIPLYELDRFENISHSTAVLLPTISKLEQLASYDTQHLNEVMSLLRAPNGCPWDQEQTHESLKECLLEETYEVIEAIELNNPDMLMEEIGDLLLQVIFHVVIAKEHGEFDLYDVTTGITKKMIERHTHIFGEAEANTSDAVITNWEKIKKATKGQQTQTEVLKAVPKQLPALMRSYKVQKKAAQVGFDWDTIEPIFDKLYEEIDEVKEAIEKNNGVEEELGDLLFTVVNLCRFYKINPEIALYGCIEKFIKRFSYMEKHADMPLEQMNLKNMDKLWVLSKKTIDELV